MSGPANDDGLRGHANRAELLRLIELREPDQAISFLKADHNLPQELLNQALMLACQFGFKYLVQRLVQIGADVNFTDANGKTPLLISVSGGFSDIVTFLLTMKANGHAIDSEGNTVLILSISHAGSRDLVMNLVDTVPMNCYHQNRSGYTALMKAVELKDVDMIRCLLESDYHFRMSIRPRTEDFHGQLVNCRGETAEQMADSDGLGDVFRILREQFIGKRPCRSPFLIAVDKGDFESLVTLLDCHFSGIPDRKELLDGAFDYIFKKVHLSEEKNFSDVHIAMIKKLIANDVDTTGNAYYDFGSLAVAVESGDLNLVELLCQNEAHRRGFWTVETDPMCLAVSTGRCDLLNILLQHAEIDRESFDVSPLNTALVMGQMECAQLLLERGARMDIRVALEQAILHRNPDYMRFVFDVFSSETSSYFSRNPEEINRLLIVASTAGNVEIIRMLLDRGADVNSEDSTGKTPLLMSMNSTVAEYLIQNGADVNQLTKLDRPLCYFLSNLNSHSSADEIVVTLLKNGANVSLQSLAGTTALMLAAGAKENVSTLQALIDFGADITQQDANGNTALLAAVDCCFQNTLFLIQICEDTTVLNAQNSQGITLLMRAAAKGSLEIVQELIRRGVDVNIRDFKKNTALFHALKPGSCSHQLVLKSLIAAVSDIDCYNQTGVTPLIHAARLHLRTAMEMLLDSDADINALLLYKEEKTALTILSEESTMRTDTLDCLNFMLKRGALASYADSSFLHRLILANHLGTVRLCINSGLGPIDAWTRRSTARGLLLPSSMSPLSVSLWCNKLTLARSLFESLYLTRMDIISLLPSKSFRHMLAGSRYEECLAYLDEISSQPLSLFALAFISVTASLGSHPERESRINSLPLPNPLKDKLLFKNVDICSVSPETEATESTSQAALGYRLFYVGRAPERDRLYFLGLEYAREMEHENANNEQFGFDKDDYSELDWTSSGDSGETNSVDSGERSPRDSGERTSGNTDD